MTNMCYAENPNFPMCFMGTWRQREVCGHGEAITVHGNVKNKDRCLGLQMLALDESTYFSAKSKMHHFEAERESRR